MRRIEAKALRKLLGVALKSWIHGHSVRKITGVPHHVIGNPEAINQPLPVAQSGHANLCLLLNDLSASLHNPTLIFGVRVSNIQAVHACLPPRSKGKDAEKNACT